MVLAPSKLVGSNRTLIGILALALLSACGGDSGVQVAADVGPLASGDSGRDDDASLPGAGDAGAPYDASLAGDSGPLHAHDAAASDGGPNVIVIPDGGLVLGPCALVDCNGHGQCEVAQGVASCSCDRGYAGDGCDACAPGFREYRGGCMLDAPDGTDPDLVLWLDASAPASLTFDDMGRVMRWADRRGGSHPQFGSDSAEERPTFDDVGLSGLPAVSFDGDEELDSLSDIPLSTFDYAIFAVVEIDAGETGGNLIQGLFTNSPGLRVIVGTEQTLRVLHRSPAGVTGGDETPAGGDFGGPARAIAVRFSTSGSIDILQLFANQGASPAEIVGAVPVTQQRFASGFEMRLGTSTHARISELLVLKRMVPQDELEAIQEYLIAKWGLDRVF